MKKKFKKLWEEVYGLNEDQDKALSGVWDRANEDERKAVLKWGSYMYAEGWKDYFVKLVGAGLVIGFFVGRATKR